ncbi:MAG: DUF488 family protein [Nitrosopumilus sp.]|nr:DUF488 family protein [Nitrosopumilus sp.]
MTIYTDSLSNLKNYRIDFYKVAVTTYLSYSLQNKIDIWMNDVAPSRSLFDKFEQEKITWEDFISLYCDEMDTSHSKSKIKWIRDFSKHNDVVLLCYESEYDPRCHRYTLKKIIEDCVEN